MSVEKSEVRLSITHELGCKMDDMLDGAKREATRQEGAIASSREAQGAVEALMLHVDKDVTEGKYDPEQSKLIKTWLQRAVQVVTNLGQQAANKRLAALGATQMAENMVKVIKTIHDDDQRKLAGEKAAEKLGEMIGVENQDGSVTGTVAKLDDFRKMTVKERRLAEEAAEAARAAQATPSARTGIPSAAPEPKAKSPVAASGVASSAIPPQIKKRGRPRKV